MNKKILIIFLLLMFLPIEIQTSAEKIFAEDVSLSVEGNGAGSQSEVSATANTNTSVSQSSDINIKNDSSSNSNTGGNSSSSNSGGSNTQTGSSSSSTDINNSNINTNSSAASSCGNNCPSSSQEASINGNGSASTNSININSQTSTTVDQSNAANINNNVSVNANTGENYSNDNNGNTGISTENIDSQMSISNKDINQSSGSFSETDPQNTSIISGNGENSVNDITILNNKDKNIKSNNKADISNFLFLDLYTGRNNANRNVGDIFISTGDILSFLRINNEEINKSLASIICEVCVPTPTVSPSPISSPSPTPTTTITPTSTPPAPTPSPSAPPSEVIQSAQSAAQSVGEVLGVSAAGEVLPITGSYFYLLDTLLFIVLFVYGWYLRLSSGIPLPSI